MSACWLPHPPHIHRCKRSCTLYNCPDHIKLFRRYVSKNAAGKARAVLEGVGLETSTIDACFSAHPLNDEEIVQAGLVKWRDGQGNKQPPTWEVLISAMEYAGVAQQHVKELKEKLGLPVKEPQVCMCTITCVTSECTRFGHVCYLYMYVGLCCIFSPAN